jgi:hypothetical protein
MMESDRTPMQSEAGTGAGSRKRGRLRILVLGAVVVVLTLCVVEGLASWAGFLLDLAFHSHYPPAEPQHTQYDPDLGWVNMPGAKAKDLFGRGRSVTINAQGFRCSHDVAVEVPPGKTRILCSGDSFTFGFGVDDRDTWCAALERLDPALEVVNMGECGYGVDQMYLLYRRDGARVRHNAHIFAVVSLDFERMLYSNFMGYGKPTLERAGSVPVADNVPVPRRAFYVPWVTQNMDVIRGLRIVQLGLRLRGGEKRSEPEPQVQPSRLMPLTLLALETMDNLDRQQGSVLIVVWLPTRDEYLPHQYDPFRLNLLQKIRSRGITAIDLVEPFRGVPFSSLPGLFLQPGEVDYPGAEAHYSAEGNRYIAGQLLPRLREILQRRSDLSSRSPR